MEDFKSIIWQNIKFGTEHKLISLEDDESRIVYHCLREYSTSFKNPEEKIRAAYYVELIRDYKYPAKRIDLEVKVERRTPDDKADIVVYEDDDCKKPYLVVEAKRDGITDAEFKQAIEQAFGNANSKRAKFASVVAGNTRTAFDVGGFKSRERERNVIADIPEKYGKAPKYKFIKGDNQRDLKSVSRQELISALSKCNDTIWQGGKLAPTTAFDEVSKLLFCKLKDEKTKPNRKYYDFQIGTNETPDEIFKRIDAIYQASKKGNGEVFNEEIRLSPKIVYSAVEHLQEISINKTDLDTKGVAFEKFMEDFFKGKMGQFFTPRNVIKFMVELLQVEHTDSVLDPACGSGGFLLNAMDYVRNYAEAKHDPLEAYTIWHNFARDNLFGIEINDQIARVCKMNMIIHDDGHTNIIACDSLEKLTIIENHHKKFTPNSFDYILTNPPFGATVKSAEKEEGFVEQFELGGKIKKRKNQQTEILFIERCIDFLKEGTGIMGIVLPDSITVNSSLQYVRDYILEKTKLLAVISLPEIAFSHYGANVKSSLLFVKRLKPNEKTNNYPVFMAIAERIGYTAVGKDDLINDLEGILEHHKRFEVLPDNLSIDKEFATKIFTVKSDELKGKRIDPKGYSPAFKRIKAKIDNKASEKIKLQDCVLSSYSGEWGKDLSDEHIPEDYQLCYVLRNTNFDNDFNLDLSDIALRYIPKNKINKLSLKENEILVEKSGGSPAQPVGRVAIVKNLPMDKPVVFSNFLQKIVINEKIMNAEYVYSYLKSLYHLGYMEFIQNQTTGIKNLLNKDFFAIDIVKLNDKEQKEMADIYIGQINSSLKAIKKAYAELNKSRQDVITKIF
ncbi:MAG: N-6 DNA methylase [Ekhidna sp.]|nr:N-6 DNA methylase [Ekhidna sp.]